MLEQLAEQYQNLSMQIRAILVALIFVGTGYFSYSDNVTSAQQTLLTANESEAKLTADITNFNRSGQNLSSIETQKRKAEEELIELLVLLPRDLEVDLLIANFSDSAKESGVKITNLTPDTNKLPTTPQISLAPPAPGAAKSGAIDAKDYTSKKTFSVTVEGSYAQIVTFFDRILNLKRVIRLDGFELTPVTEKATVLIPDMPNGSTTKTERAQDGSPLLVAKTKFAVFMQKGNLPTLQSTPETIARQTAAAPPSVTPEGLGAKPLNTPPGGN